VTHAELLDALVEPVRAAGRLIEEIRARGCEAMAKSDRSPVTEADQAAEALLTRALARIDAGAQVVGEEACEASGGAPATGARFWLLDPLDGTKSFIEGADDYSVNVGLIEDGAPVLGLLLAPATGVLWAGAVGHGAWREEADGARRAITARPLASPPAAVTSRSHLDAKTRAYVEAIPGCGSVASGSSLKFCVLAEGAADVYPRFGPTSEWDTAAGHAILRAAGGEVFAASGGVLGYGKPGCKNGGFLALGDPQALARLPGLG
jgi:3'(2'), 5'-bisphosphate nucleotidase